MNVRHRICKVAACTLVSVPGISTILDGPVVSGNVSNNRAEILALWGVLFCVKSLALDEMVVFGDSKLSIYWINMACVLEIFKFYNWLNRITSLIRPFSRIFLYEYFFFSSLYRSESEYFRQLSVYVSVL